MAGKNQDMPKMLAKRENKVDLDDQVSFTDQVYLGCILRAAHVDNRIVKEKQKLFLNLISTKYRCQICEKEQKCSRS